MTTEKKIAPWRPLEIGRRVIVTRACTAKQYRGHYGTIVESLESAASRRAHTGLARYGVRLDACSNVITDFSRFELRGLKRKGRPEIWKGGTR